MSNNDGGAAQGGSMKLIPYIFFYGRCEEALNFYKDALGGSFEITSNDEAPMGMEVPHDFKGKVMHSVFNASGLTFMASDGQSAKPIDPDEGNISLALNAGGEDQGARVFERLSAGGNVKMPYGEAPWGGKFGVFDDKFGIEWMVSSQ